MTQVLSVIAPLFIIIFASAILQKYTKMGDNWSKVLNEYALKLGLPVMIFSALVKTPFSITKEAPLIIINSVFIILSAIIAYLLSSFFNLSKQMQKTLFICLIISNIAYLGIPVLSQTFGDSIIPTASLIVAIYLFWFSVLGIGYLDYSIEKNKKALIRSTSIKLVKNPLMLSVLFGIIISTLKFQLPNIFITALDMVTVSVTPTVLLVIGLFIGKSTLGKFNEWIPVSLFTLLTLIIMPAFFYYGLVAIGLNPKVYTSSIIDAAMPLAITPFAIADEYKLNKTFIARSIVLSTILSAVTIPFWLTVL